MVNTNGVESNCHNNGVDDHLQDVVIIGAGIAGLATALALHRMGIKPMVLEQSNKLETTGGAITLWINAWKALDALGVADGLRERFGLATGFETCSPDGKLLTSVTLTRDMEQRALIRMALLEALCEHLPEDTIHYGVEVIGIKKTDVGHTEVKCRNGLKIRTKVLIGCDGVRSVVAKWMGLKDATHVGQTLIRGLATFPNGEKTGVLVKDVIGKHKQITGNGVRAGITSVTSNIFYWFIAFNTKGRRIYEPELIRKEALTYVQGWTDPIITEVIMHTPLESISRRDIVDRWTWPGVIWGPALSQGGVTLAGDALHPMTPHLAQGGCCALEDAVVLGRHLGRALRVCHHQDLDGRYEIEVIESALKTYIQERWRRTLGITIKSYMVGKVLQLENRVLCFLRYALFSKLISHDSLTNHTAYDCGKLQ